MVEGRGYAGRRQERLLSQRLSKFIKERDRITVVPDAEDSPKANLVYKRLEGTTPTSGRGRTKVSSRRMRKPKH